MGCLENWSAPNAMEHGRTPPAPSDRNAKPESSHARCLAPGGAHCSPSLHGGGCAPGIVALSHRKTIPCEASAETEPIASWR